ncbi:MAG: porin family protein [Bacteroidales bacterium]
MSRYYLLLLASLFWAFGAFAQPENTTPTWGFHAGPGFSRVVDDEALDDHARKLFPAAGIFGNFYFTERLSVQAELDFVPGGAKFASHELTMNVTYLQLPLLVRYAFFEDPKVFLQGGVYGGYLLGAKTKGVYADLEREENVNESITERIQPLDYGFCMGIGVQGRFSASLDLFAELRYHVGLRNIVKEPGSDRYNLSLPMRYPFEYDKPKVQVTFLRVGFIVYLYAR